MLQIRSILNLKVLIETLFYDAIQVSVAFYHFLNLGNQIFTVRIL
jgi:hypothetical protein